MPLPLKPVIYQLVVRYFGNTNRTNQRDGTLAVNGCGRFADVNDRALASLRELGVTHIWLTGCLRQATLTDHSSLGLPADPPDIAKGIAGSFYAVRDYFDVCPDYAVEPARRLEEFRDLVERIHEKGMKVLIDLVPNHVARSYHSIIRPDADFGTGDDQTGFFVRDNHFFYLVSTPAQPLQLPRPSHWNPPGITFTGQFPPEDGSPGHTPRATGDNCASIAPAEWNWYETVKLNHGYNFLDASHDSDPRPATWTLLDHILAYWQERGVDGFRCDMAHFVPLESWRYLIGQARQRDPHCFFLAEAYPASGPAIPVTDLDELLKAGFDAFYHSDAFNALKRVYQGFDILDAYSDTVTHLSGPRQGRLGYLENHDERRLASAVVRWRPDGSRAGPGESGFGSASAGYQLAPLQFLFGPGPILFFNGQEVGEPGTGAAGFAGDNGRTTVFDYWCMPEFSKWVNEHAYDGGRLSEAQKSLRRFYAALLKLCQDPSVRGPGYWGLRYFNNATAFADCSNDLYSFARYEPGSGRLLLVTANFRPSGQLTTKVRVPEALVEQANLPENVSIRLILDRDGAKEMLLGESSRALLSSAGFTISLPDQTAHVYAIEASGRL